MDNGYTDKRENQSQSYKKKTGCLNNVKQPALFSLLKNNTRKN